MRRSKTDAARNPGFRGAHRRSPEGDRRADGAAAHRCARSQARSAPSGGSRRCAATCIASLTPWQRVLVARHPNRPGLEDVIQRLFTQLRRDSRRPAVRRRSRDHDRLRRLQGPAGAARRPRQGRRHQGQDLPELRVRAARGLPQGASGDAARREVRRARSSSSSTRRPPIRGSSPRSAASPRRSPSTSAT